MSAKIYQHEPREYRVLRIGTGESKMFFNKHYKFFILASKEAPSRINNHIGLVDALRIIKENPEKIYLDYIT